MSKYILNGHTPVPADLMTWAKWYEKADRVVAKDKVCDSKISTVFLGLDHAFESGIPILFETMVFGGALDGEQERCSTWEQAEEMHRQMVAKVSGVAP